MLTRRDRDGSSQSGSVSIPPPSRRSSRRFNFNLNRARCTNEKTGHFDRFFHWCILQIRTLSTLKKVVGEKALWAFARKPSLES